MRRILYGGLGLLLVVAIAAAVGWVFRIPIASHFLAERLDRAGFPDASFEIRQLGWTHARIAPFALGDDGAPAIDRISARFQPLQLWRGDTRHVDISLIGLSARVEPLGGSLGIVGMPERGTERAPSVDGADGVARLAAVPTLHFRDARIRVESPVGHWSTTFDADVEGGSEGLRSARIDAGIVNNRLRVEGEASARYDGTRIDGSMRLIENDGFTVELSGRIADPAGAARTRVDYQVDMPSAADLPWPFLPGARPSAGRVTLSGNAAGHVDARRLPASVNGWLQILSAGQWRGDYRINSRDLAMTARFEDLDLEAAGDWRVENGRMSVAVGEGGELRIGRVAEPLWSRLSPPDAARPFLEGPIRIRSSAGDWLHATSTNDGDGVRFSGLPRFTVDWPERSGKAGLQARIDVTLGADYQVRGLAISDAAFDAVDLRLGAIGIDRIALVGGVNDVLAAPEGELDVSLDIPALERGDLQARALRLRLPLTVATSDEGARVTVRDGGRIQADTLTLPRGYRSADPLTARISEGMLRLDEALDYRLNLATDEIQLEMGEEGGQPGDIAFSSGSIMVSGDGAGILPAAIRLNGYSAMLPAHDLRADGIAGRLRPRAINDWLIFGIERIHQPGSQPLIAPIALAGNITNRPDGFALNGQGRLADGAVPFVFSGQALPDAAAGVVNLEVPEVAFRPAGLQPRDLLPGIGERIEADGDASGSARVSWDADGIDGSVSGTVAAMDLTIGGATISGLRGGLQLDRLRPPRTPEPQRLVADHIDAGLRIGRPTLEFEVERLLGSRLGIHVIAAEGQVVEGTVAVRNWRFDPFAQVYDPIIEVDGISLEKLLERLSINGLEGRGQLSGPIPVFITDEGVAIRDGRLRGLDGHVRYRSERAERALADTDRTVDLMLQALRDFDYEKIEIDLVREPAGASRVDIQMQGSNPDVLDGHPFDFNIAITGDVEPLLEAVARGHELTDELVERHLQLREAESE